MSAARPVVAFLSMKERGGFVYDDERAIPPLEALGWTVETVPWDAEVDWARYRAAVVRTTWDYQDRLDSFLETLARIEESGCLLYNALSTIRWNARKTYLRDLSERGVPVIATVFGDPGSGPDLPSLQDSLGARDLVIKPMVGASAFETFRVVAEESASSPAGPPPPGGKTFGGPPPILVDSNETRDYLARVFRGRSFLAQPFLPQIVDPGETSLFYFGGRYSHAVVKCPKKGDFRVQEEHGGIIAPADVPLDLVETCRAVVSLIEPEPLLARVDIVRTGETFLLMELELIEPSLYFRIVPGAAERFARALVHRVEIDGRVD